ncbi:hypothetical protein AMECASPLE_001008 [Ameca splendens]|uniref:Uncharacterized protein n=1 Tax=Ameca splendens TaxID=208324 RepID=A0ABV0ZIW8_9TELE
MVHCVLSSLQLQPEKRPECRALASRAALKSVSLRGRPGGSPIRREWGDAQSRSAFPKPSDCFQPMNWVGFVSNSKPTSMLLVTNSCRPRGHLKDGPAELVALQHWIVGRKSLKYMYRK